MAATDSREGHGVSKLRKIALRRGPVTHIYVHRDVPGIALHKGGRQPRPRIVRLDVPSWKLSDLAREKFRTLEGCDRVCRDARGRPEYC